MIIEIIRLDQTEHGTMGSVLVDGRVFCTALERPWVDENHDGISDRNVSCIPPGTYVCRRVHSPRFGVTFEVAGIPERTHILFHAGNTIKDTHGCILLGASPRKLRGNSTQRRVNNSGETFREFMAYADAENVDEFTLVVTQYERAA